MENQDAGQGPAPWPPQDPTPPATDPEATAQVVPPTSPEPEYAGVPPNEPATIQESTFGHYLPPLWPGYARPRMRGADTLLGIRCLRHGTLIAMVAGVFVAAAHFFLLVQVSMLREGIIAQDVELLLSSGQWYDRAAIAALAGVITAVIGASLGFAGFYFLGRYGGDFGDRYTRSLRRANAFLVAACVAEFALVAMRLSTAIGLETLPENPTTTEFVAMVEQFYVFLPREALLVLAFSLFSSMAMLSAVARLATREGPPRASAFVALSMVAALTFLIAAIAFPVWVGRLPSGATVPEELRAAFLQFFSSSANLFWLYLVVDVLSLSALAAYTLLLRSARRGVLNMVATGGMDPDDRPMTVAGAVPIPGPPGL